MFNYQLVVKEINLLFDQASLAKSAAWDAMAAAGKSNQEMAEFRMNDLEIHIKEMSRQLKDLKIKVDMLKTQGNPQS